MRIRAFQIAILLLAATAAGQDDAWETKRLDAETLATARKKIEKELRQPAKEASEEEKAWFAARKHRVELLGDLEKAVLQLRLLPEAAASKTLQEQLEAELARLRETPEPAAPVLKKAEDLVPIEEAAQAAVATAKSSRAELEKLKSTKKEFERGVQDATTREAELRAQIEAGKEHKAGSVQEYRRVNAEIELRHIELYAKNAGDTRKQIDASILRAQAAVDLHQERANRAGRRLEEGRKLAQKLAAQEADEKREEAKRLAEQADLERDPLEKFIVQTKSTVSTIRGDIKDDEAAIKELDQNLVNQKAGLSRYERELDRIRARVESRRVIAGGTAELLHSTLARTKVWLHEIQDSARRNIDRRIDAVLNALGPVQDEYWELEGSLRESPQWLALSALLPAERRDAAYREFDKAIRDPNGLGAALRDRIKSLETRHQRLNEIDSIYEAQTQALINLETYIASRIYWAKTDDRVKLSLIPAAVSDLGNLREFYGEEEFSREMRASFEKQPVELITASLLLIALLVGVTLAARRIRSRPMRPPADGEKLKDGLLDAGRVLIHSAAPSLVLLLASALVNRVDLPVRVTFPLGAGLDVVALLLFVQRLAWGLLNKRGYLIAHFDVSREVGRQVLRSVRVYTWAGMLFWLPLQILREAPFEVASLTRIFGTTFRICELTAIAMLLPRNQPVARAFVSGSEIGLRILGILSPLGFLLLALVAGMDLLGYRYGAIFFTRQAIETTLVIIILRALYAGLNQISGRVTERVRERAFREQGGTAAWEDSSVVTRQLTRLITVGTIVAAAVFIGRSWDFGSAYSRVFNEWRVVDLANGSFISAADLIHALVLVLFAHFLSSNIAGIFELVVFPIFGSVHRGTRFVVLALSRYLILLIGYSGALIAVHFSVSSLGWLLAAASVGLGFGLQEIVANFVSGLILLVEQPVRVGDVISVGDSGGTVERITIRSTLVTDWDQRQIIIPNKTFITQNLINWTRNNNFTRRKIPVNVAYGSDVEKVLRVLEETVKGVENVRSYPPPRIWFDGFGAYALEFMVWIYVDLDFGFATMSNARRSIIQRLRDEGIEIPFPQQDLHIKQDPMEDLQGMAGMLDRPPPSDPEAGLPLAGEPQAGGSPPSTIPEK